MSDKRIPHIFLGKEIRTMDKQHCAAASTMRAMILASGKLIADRIEAAPEGEVLFFCGPGNNGADGLAAASLLGSKRKTAVVLIDEGKANEDWRFFKQAALDVDVKVISLEETYYRSGVSVAVDALLGSGAREGLMGEYACAAQAINALGQNAFVLAVDIPTGAGTDTGHLAPNAVRASQTLALSGLKMAHVLYPAAENAGEVIIGYPFESEYQPPKLRFLFNENSITVPKRSRYSHKGTYGRLLIIAGSAGLAGAGKMSAQSALRSGCGTLVVAAPKSTAALYRQAFTEAMTFALPEDEQGGYTAALLPAELINSAQAVLIGPGMGKSEGVWAHIECISRSGLPMVIDADGLNALARHPGWEETVCGRAVLTPHPAELARLIGSSTKQVLDDPLRSVETMAERSGCVCLLKMASTIIAAPDKTAVSVTGCAGMAKGGSGDVLSGCIASLLAQGMSPFEAACLGAYVCGLAGELAQKEMGARAMQPTDTIRYLPMVFKRIDGE